MKNDASLLVYLLHQLSDLGVVDPRSMFGSYGLYHHGVFFGIVSDGTLFLKTDERTVERYQLHGMHPFQPNPRQILRTYYRVPDLIVETPSELAEWAREAIAAQRRARATR